ncbi:uncharacterized protein LOC119077213 [Bradysia coprophila]|uniref:uncharacterized protein LOC119077213 n=1 Tax=Bradysia coprophila TaxID=38358 RepID=UPI00187D7D96|nr:uncharacterized protein LOC119077213 [Bradysia coprophila]
MGVFGGNGGSSFDDVALSDGYRILSIKVRSAGEVDAIQLTERFPLVRRANFRFFRSIKNIRAESGRAGFHYKILGSGRARALKISLGRAGSGFENRSARTSLVTYGNTQISGKLCPGCTNYKDEWAPAHGGTGGHLTTVFCPAEGVITGIKYRSGSRLDSITFICTSAIGVTELGPFGGNGGSAGEEKCPPGSYISSIHGRSGERVDALGIRCRRVEETGSGPKRDAHGGNGGYAFDDSSYTTNQRRPVQIRIRHAVEVDMIQIKYGNMPVSMNCKVSNIKVTDQSIIASSDGYAVIGFVTGSTCSMETQSLHISQAATEEETTGVETSEGGELNWSTTVSVGFSFGIDIFAKTEISRELSQSFGGSRSWSQTRSNSSSTGSTSTVGTTVNYQGPGACLLIGTMKRYKIEQNSVPVLYDFKCEGGVSTPKPGTIKLSSTTFDQASFVDLSHSFESVDECSSKARMCVSSIQAGKLISDPWSIKKEFQDCFK